MAAAGSGERLGVGGPKAFVPLAGRPMIEWSIAAMRATACVRSIVVACPPGHVHGGLDGDDLVLVDGGSTRAHSVANALAAVETELVAIHDAARPLVTPELIGGVVATLVADPEVDGAIAAIPVTDTIKQVEGGAAGCSTHPDATRFTLSPSGGANVDLVIGETLDRGRLWAAQTPQVFRVEALRRALEADLSQVEAVTDEAMLIEAVGGRVLIHPGSPENIKVTTPLDLKLAEALLEERSAQ
ncbi:MAG TPA: 2-C-methyl-D-erythritol 4-phosphate cytidylyltransferase [Solirubrobacterales bacterium]|nr:2-C-methyl-D-erythritol 4-phosphate cytidylyltransferase [Solirubrobacterales bacterium]